jgi:tetratricopeptide (TPR) repeat protein
MDLHPWDLWTPAGEPKTDTAEILATLEAVLALQPDNPGANHLYVHASEASLHPERALAAADRLRDLVPGAGHLVHMPAHIDLRLGHYAEASLANVRAMGADRKHADRFPRAGFYRVYMAHNPHFLAFSSMMEGRYAAALEAARTMVREVPQEFVTEAGPLIDGYLPVVCHVYVRFGRWQEVLDEPPFPEHLVFSNATLAYARGVALAALGRVEEAEQERARVVAAIAKIDDRVIGINQARVVLGIAEHMLAGEIALRRGEHDVAIRELREAMVIEDGLRYMEPPDWIHPVRHALGAVLLVAGKPAEAEQAFREDLARFPENGWSLKGLGQALRAQGKEAEAAAVEARFAKAWARADVTIGSSCLCVPDPARRP